jgi:hypothetical protein
MLRGEVDNYNIARIFAILSYFTKSITYEIHKSVKPEKKTILKRFFGRIKVVPTPAPTISVLKLWSQINEDKTIDFYALGTGVSAKPEKLTTEELKYDILDPPSPKDLVDSINDKVLTPLINNGKLNILHADDKHLVTFTIKAFNPRNMIQHDLLQNLLRMLNLYVNGSPTASGGSKHKLHKTIVMKKTGKQYKVYMDSKGPFIKVKKEPIHLRSLKGKYTYAM